MYLLGLYLKLQGTQKMHLYSLLLSLKCIVMCTLIGQQAAVINGKLFSFRLPPQCKQVNRNYILKKKERKESKL